jgi:hypothetical protein
MKNRKRKKKKRKMRKKKKKNKEKRKEKKENQKEKEFICEWMVHKRCCSQWSICWHASKTPLPGKNLSKGV